MDSQTLINKSKKLFSDFKGLDDSLYKGNFRVNDKLAGIYYLNFGKDITEEYFENLQYKYLAEEFYNNDDNLQWNIYLIFIESNIPDELKLKILTDDKYARKLIFKEEDFFEYFELEKTNKTSLPDIVSNWKNELNKVDLQEVYSNIPYTSAIQNFLIDSTNKNISNNEILDTSTVIKIEKVNRIELTENFREYPALRNFDFRAVNLFNGRNGSGKTSLLESIELLITGKSFRNPENNELENSINGILNGSIQDAYTSFSADKYKARDIKWYNRNHLTKGNNCQVAFNQFNFFNTDAAYQFSSSDHEDQINESLKQIILGPEYVFLRDRIQGFEVRLRPELNGLEKKLKEQDELIKKNSKLIEGLKSDKDILEIRKKISDNISAINFKKKFLENEYSVSNLSINDIKTDLSYILNRNLAYDFNSLKSQKNKVKDKLGTVNFSKEEYDKRINTKLEITSNLKFISKKRTAVINVLKYFILENVNKIEDIDQELQLLNKLYLQFERIKKRLSGLSYEKFLNENRKFIDLQITKNEELKKTSNEIKKLEEEIIVINNNFSIIEDLVNNIKLLGNDFLTHSHYSQTCPLCEQRISREDLLASISKNFNNNTNKSILREKSEKLSILKAQEMILNSDIKMLDNLKLIANDETIEFATLTVNEILNILNSIMKEEKTVLSKKEKLELTLAQIKTLGGSLSEFKSYKEEIKTYLNPNDSFDKDNLEKLLSDLDNQIKTIEQYTIKIDKENEALILEINKKLERNEITSDINRLLKIVTSENENLLNLEKSFINIQKHLNLPDDKSITDLSKEINTLEENIKSLRDSEIKQNELQRITKELEDAKSFMNDNISKHTRLENAVKVLQKLKLNDGENALAEYFKNNLKEIKDIFKTIHSPQEFTNLTFENKKLILLKNDLKYTISQISTGQRAALAISIFISLNRKLKNGPNVIIFDDPVTFIDDFNALSFLDFLRYFIVKEKKQIFFATANKKFSILFKKKFEFLGDDFKEFELKR